MKIAAYLLVSAAMMSSFAACTVPDPTSKAAGSGTGNDGGSGGTNGGSSKTTGNDPGPVSPSKNVVDLGVVTGNVYSKGAQSLIANPEQFFCEMNQLGASYIRVDFTESGVSAGTYRYILERAKAHGIKVIALVDVKLVEPNPEAHSPLSCPVSNFDPTTQAKDHVSIDTFTAAYVANLSALASKFKDADHDFSPWAWEIVNEPNNTDTTCSDNYRLGGNPFAWLLRRVHEWKVANGISSLLISGGTAGVYPEPNGDGKEDAWWAAFAGSGAWDGTTMFDYFGVHPYNRFNYNLDCDKGHPGDCNADWASYAKSVRQQLQIAKQRLLPLKFKDLPPFLATEFGFQQTAGCNPRQPDNCEGSVRSEQDVVDGMAASLTAYQGLVDIALWYVYRDDAQSFGLRQNYDASAGKYPAHPERWHAFASFAHKGASDGGNPDQCWAPATTCTTYLGYAKQVVESDPTTAVHRWVAAGSADEAALLMNGWKDEMRPPIHLSMTPSDTPVYECVYSGKVPASSLADARHFFSTDPGCDQSGAAATAPVGYLSQAPAGSRATALYRLPNFAKYDNVYTVDEAFEKYLLSDMGMKMWGYDSSITMGYTVASCP